MKYVRVLPVGFFVLSLCFMGGVAHAADRPITHSESKQNSKQTPRNLLSDPNKVLVVDKHDPTFTINLKSNPSTGYFWVLAEGYDHDLITPISHHFHAATQDLVGAPGYESFTFKVNQQGFNVPQKSKILFQYVRPWVVMDNVQKMNFTIMTTNSNTQ